MTAPRTEETTLIRVHPRPQGRLQRADWRAFPTDGQGWWIDADIVPPPAAVISSLTPNTAVVTAPAALVTIAGSNFVSGSVVEIDGVAQTTTFVSATSLTVNYDPTTEGTKVFRVRNGATLSNPLSFTVTATALAREATNPEEFTIAVLQAWVDAPGNDQYADEMLAAERARGDAARTTLIDWLEGFIEHRDA